MFCFSPSFHSARFIFSIRFICVVSSQNVLFLVLLRNFQIPCPSSLTFSVAMSSTRAFPLTVVVAAGYKFVVDIQVVSSRFYSLVSSLPDLSFLPTLLSFSLVISLQRSVNSSISFPLVSRYVNAPSFFVIFFLRLLLKHFLFLLPSFSLSFSLNARSP